MQRVSGSIAAEVRRVYEETLKHKWGLHSAKTCRAREEESRSRIENRTEIYRTAGAKMTTLETLSRWLAGCSLLSSAPPASQQTR